MLRKPIIGYFSRHARFTKSFSTHGDRPFFIKTGSLLRDRGRKTTMMEAGEAPGEKRKMQRFSIALPSNFEVKAAGSAATNCISRDVCACGGFFLTENPPPIGTQLMVQMFLQIDEPEKNDVTVSRISVWGTVIRTEKSGMGVRFDKRYKITFVRD